MSSAAATSIDLTILPPEARAAVETLVAENTALSEKNAALSSRTADLEDYAKRLEHLVKEFRRARFGKGSEKLTENQRQLRASIYGFSDPI